MYNIADIKRTLEVLGFHIRDPDGGTSAYCIHGITKDELWIPTNIETVDDDVLEFLFEPTKLPFGYFKGVYIGLNNSINNHHSSDEY